MVTGTGLHFWRVPRLLCFAASPSVGTLRGPRSARVVRLASGVTSDTLLFPATFQPVLGQSQPVCLGNHSHCQPVGVGRKSSLALPAWQGGAGMTLKVERRKQPCEWRPHGSETAAFTSSLAPVAPGTRWVGCHQVREQLDVPCDLPLLSQDSPRKDLAQLCGKEERPRLWPAWISTWNGRYGSCF